jgi:hypothetical protein
LYGKGGARRAAALSPWGAGCACSIRPPAEYKAWSVKRGVYTEMCPVRTEGGTRRVRLVRKEGRDVSG